MLKEISKFDGEEFAAYYLHKKLNLPYETFEMFEDNDRNKITSKFSALKEHQKIKDHHTPDIVIGGHLNASLEDLFFLDVNSPRGGLLTETSIALDKEISSALARSRSGEVVTVELTKQVKRMLNGVRSKLIGINKKYAKNRDKQGSISINTGIIYCLDSDGNSPHPNDLDAYQLSITALELCHELSGGYCQFNDIETIGLNRVTQFNFAKNFENVGFVAFVGRGSLANQSYIYVNKRFLLSSKNIFAKLLSKVTAIDGNGFRTSPTFKSRLVLDFMSEPVDLDNRVFPFGNINFMGDVIPGLEDIPLSTCDTSSIHARFDKAIAKRDNK